MSVNEYEHDYSNKGEQFNYMYFLPLSFSPSANQGTSTALGSHIIFLEFDQREQSRS